MKRIYIPVLLVAFALSAKAQKITYNHDDAKMNQITVQETGGRLPDSEPVLPGSP